MSGASSTSRSPRGGMRGVLRASLRAHLRRYVAAVLAVVAGVGFVVVTDALASATRAGLLEGIDRPYRAADAVVTGLGGSDADRLVQAAEDSGASASVVGYAVVPVAAPGRAAADAEVAPLAADPALRWQQLDAGRWPDEPGEVLLDARAAATAGVEPGDTLRIGAGSRALAATVVGTVGNRVTGTGGGVYLTWPDLAPWVDDLYVDSLAWAGPGVDAAVAGTTGAEVEAPAAFVRERATQVNNGVDVIGYLLLFFAAIALFVSVLVIANTFSILLAHRTREIALLRCIGADRRQVRRAVRTEALAIGVGASLLGLLVGAGTGWALAALARGLGAPLGAVSLTPSWLVGAFAVGVLVTCAASWLPTRRATSTSPLGALRPDHDVDVRSTAGRVRLVLGALLVAGGGALLALAVAATSAPVMLAGGFATFGGVLLLGPVLVPALVRLAGVPLGRLLGPTARLATANAVRNPRRTAATTASLLVGVTLTTAVLTGLASSRGALDADMSRQHPLDTALSATGGQPLPADLAAEVAARPGVARAVAVDGVAVPFPGGDPLPLVAASAGSPAADVARSDLPRPRDGEVLVPSDRAAEQRVRVADGVRLRVRPVEGLGGVGLVSPATLARLGGTPVPQAVWVRADGGTDADDLASALAPLAEATGAQQDSGLARRAAVDRQLDVLTAAVVTLLGIAVVIALLGIANTLGLSVLERGREHALLRALGLSRRRLRAVLAGEAVLLAVVATVLGTALGVLFAGVGVAAVVAPVVQAPLVLPWAQLAAVVGVAALAGLVAAVLPSRRAARVAPAAGLTLDQ